MTSPKVRDEFERIATLFAPLSAGLPGAFGLTDDAAILDIPADRQVVVTTDAIVAGVHFLPDDPPALVARKLVRVNLSDLAAMAAEPMAVFSACAFPRGGDEAWIEAFAKGLAADLRQFGVPLGGGDTVATPGPPTFALTALGTVPRGEALLRRGARVGDLIVVSATIGDAALGLLAAQGALADRADAADIAFLDDRYHLPQPRLTLGTAIRGLARAGMDISDGLLQDLGHLCTNSGVGADVVASAIPLSPAAARLTGREPDLFRLVVGGGDDYELLLAVPPEAMAALQAASPVPLTVIGRFIDAPAGDGPRVRLLDDRGQAVPVPQTGYRHF